jgi:hypothetical protein
MGTAAIAAYTLCLDNGGISGTDYSTCSFILQLREPFRARVRANFSSLVCSLDRLSGAYSFSSTLFYSFVGRFIANLKPRVKWQLHYSQCSCGFAARD